MVTDSVMMGKTVSPLFFSAVFHPFLFIIAGNDDMHESWDDFELQPDWIHFKFVSIKDMHNI